MLPCYIFQTVDCIEMLNFGVEMQGEIGIPIYSPVPESLYPVLAVLLLATGLLLTAFFFM